MNADPIRTERVATNSKLFAHTRWDSLPAVAGLFHLSYFFALFLIYPHAPLWSMLLMGSAYALMVNANTNGVGHNFIHNPFFRAPLLNRLFGVTQSIACCFSQTYYDAVHMSITRATPTARTRTGKRSTGCRSIGTGTGEPENPWRYVFLSFFRDNPAAIARELKKRRQIRAVLGQH